MAFQITIQSNGHSFAAGADETILEAADNAGIILPYGCRDGACGSCKGKILQGAVDHGMAQERALSSAERAAGMSLFCCATPMTDLIIETREVNVANDIPARMLPCRVQMLERAAPDVMIMSLKLPTNERLQFRAGQYIEFVLKDGKRRAFSLANAPHDDALLQLHLRLTPQGQFTTHVFETMKVKEILRIEGPFGTFFLREDSDKPIILVAGGTGFAPIKAIIEHAIHNKMFHRPMTLYWGARDRSGLYLPELPQQWVAQHANIKYIPVLSDATPADQWTGRKGLVHQAVLENFESLAGVQVYACGAPAMIDAVRSDFIEHGLPSEEFFADSFTFAAS